VDLELIENISDMGFNRLAADKNLCRISNSLFVRAWIVSLAGGPKSSVWLRVIRSKSTPLGKSGSTHISPPCIDGAVVVDGSGWQLIDAKPHTTLER
jgi:hypothetical protein